MKSGVPLAPLPSIASTSTQLLPSTPAKEDQDEGDGDELPPHEGAKEGDEEIFDRDGSVFRVFRTQEQELPYGVSNGSVSNGFNPPLPPRGPLLRAPGWSDNGKLQLHISLRCRERKTPHISQTHVHGPDL